MVVRLLAIVASAAGVGFLVYGGCVVWPLQMFPQTGLVAALSVAFAWCLVLAVFLDSRSSSSGDRSSG